MKKREQKHQKELRRKRTYSQEQIISAFNEIDLSGTYSYASYLKWKFEERVELIKGKVFQMGAPSVNHQRLLGFIHWEMYSCLRDQSCEVFAAPFDVRFPDKSTLNSKVFTVLQPDVCVVCDDRKLDKRGCIGAPDIVVEILSRGNSKTELKYKYGIYEKYGVREYWVVQPDKKSVLKYVLSSDGRFVAGVPYDGGKEFVSDILPGFRMKNDDFFGVMRDD